MPANDWPFTQLGLTFFQGQLPALIKNTGRIAAALERIATQMEKEKAPKHHETCPMFNVENVDGVCTCDGTT
jgi:hypothetical protein